MYKPTDDSYFESKAFQELLARYEHATEKGQAVLQDADELTDIADFYHYTHQEDKAKAAIEKALVWNPGATAPLVYKINEALETNDLDTANSLLTRIADHFDLEYLYTKGTLMLAEKHPEEAVDFFEKQWKLIDEDDRNDFAFDVTSIFCDYDMAPQAERWFARTEEDSDEEYKELKARLCFCQKDFAQSGALYEELTDSKPLCLRYWAGWGQSLYMQDKVEDALNAFEYALAIDDTSIESIGGKAFCLYRMGKCQEALPYYERYCTRFPDDDIAMHQWGFSLIKLGEHRKAAEILGPLATKDCLAPSLRKDVFDDCVYALTLSGNYHEALETIDKSVSYGCDKVDADIARAMIYIRQDERQQWRDAFERALQQSSDTNATLMKIAIAYYEYGNTGKAFNYFAVVEETVGGNYPRLACYQAICCYDMMEESDFFVYLKRAIACDPELLKRMFSDVVPYEVPVEDYPDYFKKNFNKQE